MDWSTQADDAPIRPSSALDLGASTWLAEETSLAPASAGNRGAPRAAGPSSTAAGAELAVVLATEQVAVPLDLPVPRSDQPVVGFGAAASLVHPASRVLGRRRAQRGASAGRRSSGSRTVEPGRPRPLARLVGDLARGAAARPRSRSTGSTSSRLSAGDIRAFFGAFFPRPVDAWAPYLAGTAHRGESAAHDVGVRRLPSQRAGCCSPVIAGGFQAVV